MRRNLIMRIYYTISKILKEFAYATKLYPKRGRKPKIEDWEIAAAFIVSYLTYTPVLKFFQMNIDNSVRSWHVFRRNRMKRVYKLLRQFLLTTAFLRIFIAIMLGLERKLIVDGTILPVANVSRARTHKIKRFKGKAFWVKRKRKLYSPHYQKTIEFEELYYGVLVMFICDESGVVYDVWFVPGSTHEVRALRTREEKSPWCKYLLNSFEVLGDKGYRGVPCVHVCSRKKLKAIRQIVESLIGGTKGFGYSRWRKGITLLAYLYGFALGFSYLRNINRRLVA